MNTNSTKRIFINIPPISIIILLIVAFVVYYFSMNVPWLGDDTLYSLKISERLIPYERSGVSYISGNEVEKIDDVISVIESQNIHYYTINGRYTAHFLVQLFCGILGQTWFSIFNSIIYVLFFYFLLKLCGKSLKDSKSLLLAVTLSFFSFIITFTPSTQIGYIWIFTFALLFLILLFGKNRNIWWTFPLFLLGLFAGNGNETLSVGLSGALLFYLILKGKKLSFQKWVMIFGYGLGTLIILLSPGSWSRVDRLDPINIKGLIFSFLTSIWVLYVLGIILIGKINKGDYVKNFFKNNYVYFVCLIFCILFCALARTFDFRSLSGANLCGIILILKLVRNNSIRIFWIIYGIIALIIFWLIQWKNSIGQIKNMQEIEEQYKINNNEEIYVDLWPSTPFVSFLSYCLHLNYNLNNNNFNRNVDLYQLWLQNKYNTTKKMSLYPKALKNRANSFLNSQIVEFHPGTYLVIMEEGEKRKVNIDRGFDVGIFTIPYDVYTPSLNNPIKEGPNWKAYIVYDDMYLVSNLKAKFK